MSSGGVSSSQTDKVIAQGVNSQGGLSKLGYMSSPAQMSASGANTLAKVAAQQAPVTRTQQVTVRSTELPSVIDEHRVERIVTKHLKVGWDKEGPPDNKSDGPDYQFFSNSKEL